MRRRGQRKDDPGTSHCGSRSSKQSCYQEVKLVLTIPSPRSYIGQMASSLSRRARRPASVRRNDACLPCSGTNKVCVCACWPDEAIEKGKSVIIDRQNFDKGQRASWIEIAHRQGASACGIVLGTSYYVSSRVTAPSIAHFVWDRTANKGYGDEQIILQYTIPTKQSHCSSVFLPCGDHPPLTR